MKLSQEAKHCVQALILLAKKPPGTVMLLEDIANADGLPRFLLAKTFQKLARHGVLQSFRGGAVRGYALARLPREITLQQILGAVEGPEIFKHCIFWSQACSEEDPCPLHHEWKQIGVGLREGLMQRTLEDVAKGVRHRRRAAKRTVRRVARARRR